MHSKLIRLALFSGSLLLLVHTAIAQIIPVPATPPPIIDPGTIIGPPPTPTIPPASPPPIGTSLGRPDPQRATAVIRWGQGSTLVPKNDQGRFQKVALQPAQVVTVVLTLGLADFGKPADVQILDGGAISTDPPQPKDIVPATSTPFPTSGTGGSTGPTVSPSPPPTISPTPPRDLDDLIDTGRTLTVSQAGELIFRFKPGADIGLHRVSVIVGGTQYFFQFWRQNPSAPNNNPRMLRAY